MKVMAKKLDMVKTGWPIPVKTKDDFVEFCAHVGSIAQEDCAGSLFLWQNMPAMIREWAKLAAKGSPVVDKQFWDGLSNLIDASVQGLCETEKARQKKKSPKSG